MLIEMVSSFELGHALFENNVDPYRLASQKLIDQDLQFSTLPINHKTKKYATDMVENWG